MGLPFMSADHVPLRPVTEGDLPVSPAVSDGPHDDRTVPVVEACPADHSGLRRVTFRDRQWRDGVRYSVLRDDFDAAR
ncbi:hypothetical protein AB0D27_11815 [Streptomyces sp. NPDC048415]|uniref:hypothetical protein n=1 Tax=Streptomyces sp. NPDC048415 TaxID=3154822 RepID=UPI0034291801